MRLAIATPCFGGLVHAATAGAIAQAMVSLTAGGHQVTWMQISNESLVPRARNMLVRNFLGQNWDRLLFVDGDIDAKLRDFYSVAHCDVDVVGGAYPFKKEGNPAAVYEPMPGGGEQSGMLVEVARIGTGFLCISRHALERMVIEYPETVYQAHGGSHDGAIVHALFDTAIRDGRYLSEDWLFCDRWRAIGGRVWMHTGVQLGHIGSKIFRTEQAA